MSILFYIILMSLSRAYGQQLTHFSQYTLLSTGACGDHSSIFEVGLFTVIQCMLKCWSNSDCNGVTYNPVHKICTGYSEPWHGTACASLEISTSYYVKELTIGVEAWQSSTYCDACENLESNQYCSGISTIVCGDAFKAIDGDANGVYSAGSCMHTFSAPGFWLAKLTSPVWVRKIAMFPRTDCCADRGQDLIIRVAETRDDLGVECSNYTGQPGMTPNKPTIVTCVTAIYGQYVKIINSSHDTWHMCEVVIRPE